MSIPDNISIKHNNLPDSPGVYFYYDKKGNILYIGKATSLKKRVNSYFTKAHNARLAELVANIAKIDYIQTPTVLEALVLEANEIKRHKPKYNILLKDDKSFLYLCITNEEFPKPLLLRGHDLERLNINPFAKKLSPEAKKKYLAVFGPYTSGHSLRKALDYLRKIIPWSTCEPPEVTGKSKPCFNRHIKLCPGVCTGEINSKEYKQNIKQLIQFFKGNKINLIKKLEREMQVLAKNHQFEQAALIRNRISALTHIRDVALITKEDFDLPVPKAKKATLLDLDGRIEGYDISNISGTSSVGVMTVLKNGQVAKDQYRKFRIKTVEGSDDYASLQEVIRRRLKRAQNFPKAWPLPEIMVIDGGKGQLSAVQQVLDEMNIKQPIIGLAKGYDRKQDRLIFDRSDERVMQIAQRGKELFQLVRDEAHRFAIKYHKQLRSRNSGIKKPRT